MTTNPTTTENTPQAQTRPACVTPPANIRQKDDGSYLLQIEMPGVAKDAVDVSVEGNELTVTGRRSFPAVSGAALHREIRRADFRRTFELDAAIDTQRIAARVDQGVLCVTLPLADAVKPRRIPVAE